MSFKRVSELPDGPLAGPKAARLLVASPWGLGEAVLVRLLLQELSARFPALRIGVLVGRGPSSEVMSLGGCLQIHRYHSREAGGKLWGSLRTIYALRRMGYDTALDCEGRLVATAAFLRAAAIPVRIGFVRPTASLRGLFLTHTVEFAACHSYWHSLVALARHIDPGFPTVAPSLSLSPDATVKSRVDQWLREQEATAPTRRLALHVGSGDHANFKRWPIARFIELAERIRTRVPNLFVILTGTPTERSLIKEFAASFRGHCADATVLGSVQATALLLEKCDLLVSNDTGVMHLGSALGTPTVGLFGATDPAHWAPVGIRATQVYPTRVNCSPCLDSYYRGVNPLECRNPEYQRCMLDIQPAHVIEAAKRVVTDDWLG